jgi:nitrite reductase/ring-hydroxylating ferredoxin subunit
LDTAGQLSGISLVGWSARPFAARRWYAGAMTQWQRALPFSALRERERAVVRLGKRQIALFVVGERVFACNNRCPHEGYPLIEGSLDERCVLTCNWHNWKFDLERGTNLLGGDALRIYPTRVENGEVLVDVSAPPLGERVRSASARFDEALDDDDYTRIARELARLEALGQDAETTLRHALLRTLPRLEFGWTHAYAGAADWLELRDELEDPGKRFSCALEICAHLARDGLRRPEHPFPGGRRDFSASELVSAIDAEDEARAAALIRDGVKRAAFAELERALTEAALLHYSDFGHSLIYVEKAVRLIQRYGFDAELSEGLLLLLARSLVHAQREDLIPEFRAYAPALAAFGSGESNLPAPEDFVGLGVPKALSLVVAHSSAPPLELYRTLFHVVAQQMLSFDASWEQRSDRPVSDNVGWLDMTHALTFAHAVRTECERHPELWPRGLLQLACFAGRNEAYVDRAQDSARWRVEDDEAFFDQRTEQLLDHGVADPIVSVHLLKTLLAVRAEYRAGYGNPVALAAVQRFFHTPLKRRHVRRTARQALAFVAREE